MTGPRRGTRVSTHRLVHIYRSEGHEVAALSGVDLEVAPGEMVGLLGPSGAGKSTLLQLVERFYDATAGTVRVAGTDVRELPRRALRAMGPSGRPA